MLRVLALVVFAAVIFAGWDFVSFIGRAERAITAASAPADADAVVSLTGASDARIVSGVQLAEDMRLPLLISGVHIDTQPADIAGIAGVRETEIQCCVTLGRAAATTEGNGAEVAEWARRHKLTRIIVVTSEYHMDRAMIELRRAMPEADFIPYAVASMKVAPRDWYRDQTTARRFAEEWIKYRVASLRAGQEADDPPAAAAAPTTDSAG
ncbi:MAG: YdcF family protein [Alphaproteobacteria bacterium]|nr:YdcF family protein [Alphaproteobacteria bacterium]